ncbi:MAG: SPOR domain-containing protein [Pseudomonadota bacterium]
MTRNPLTVRDYKKTRRSQIEFARLRDFGTGVVVGIVLASGVFLYARSVQEQTAEDVRPEPRRPVQTAEAAAPEPDADPAAQYDFYEMLPKFEVVVPEKEREVRRDVPASRIERPGVYVLQAGSYRNLRDAERVRAQLALQGIDAKVQRVAVDNDVWHRVRIGPIGDLGELNRLRNQLQAAEVDVLVIRVGD